LRYSGDSSRLFFEYGFWHKQGRNLRARCDLWVEGISDAWLPAAASALRYALRMFAGAMLSIGSMLIVSISVQVWLEPLLAYYFNRLSWISPLANLVIVPFSSLVLSAGMIASMAMNIPILGIKLIQLAGWLASALLWGAGRITIISGAWQRSPTPSILWVAAGILLLFAWSFFEWRRVWLPCLYIFAILAALSCGWRLALTEKKNPAWASNALLRITFLDVGEGDSAIISFPNGQRWAIDAGGLRQPPSGEEGSYALDIGEAVVSRYLWHEWITKLDRAILSHPDIDHAGGMLALIKNFPIARLDYSLANDDLLNSILEAARKKKMQLNALHSGNKERVGEVEIHIFNPPEASILSTTNDNSIVLEITYGQFSALFTGDLEKKGEFEVLNHSWELKSALLKVAHHGSRSGTSDAFLDRTRPRWALVSVGRNNQFGHPSRDVINRLLTHGVQPILTLDQGAVTFETDGVACTISSYVCGIIKPPSPIRRK
jgi:competence protein ComEC